MTQCVTTFDTNNSTHATVAQWRWRAHGTTRTWRGQARVTARLLGEAKVLLANGHVLRYWRDEDGRIRQRTYTRVHYDAQAQCPIP